MMMAASKFNESANERQVSATQASRRDKKSYRRSRNFTPNASRNILSIDGNFLPSSAVELSEASDLIDSSSL